MLVYQRVRKIDPYMNRLQLFQNMRFTQPCAKLPEIKKVGFDIQNLFDTI